MYTYFQSKPLNAKELEYQIEKILEDDSETSYCEEYLGALTAADRQPWAHARKKHFSKGVNRSSLYAIEKAAFVVILLEEEFPHSPKVTHIFFAHGQRWIVDVCTQKKLSFGFGYWVGYISSDGIVNVHYL